MKIKFESVKEFCEKFPERERFNAEGPSWSISYGGQDLGSVKSKVRCARWDDSKVFVFKPKSKKWGCLWPIKDFISYYTVIVPEQKSEAQQWERRMRNVIKRLDKSGLWPDVKTELESVLAAGYENRDKSRDIYQCKTKSIYFGKFNNDIEKYEIADALANERPYYTRVQAGYDVSFQYDPKTKHAWYSEEYRGCGNGHYYIALDANMALFVEDD